MSASIVSKGGPSRGFCIIVHGGAGAVPEARRPLHAEGCRRAALAAAEVLREGGTALAAVEAAVRLLEDDPLYNAGTGACLNEEGVVEHDASIMEGAALRAGAVCALEGFKNPVSIARAALQHGVHVLYAAHGAARFARRQGFVEVPMESLITDGARQAFEAVRDKGATSSWAGNTVGAVARDRGGSTAAATSTGGLINKHAGRVGDTPLIGAGTYADDRAGAVSVTGHGEGAIRIGAARVVATRMELGESAEEASRVMVGELGARVGATGGSIAVDREGRWGWARNTATMSWAMADEDGDQHGC